MVGKKFRKKRGKVGPSLKEVEKLCFVDCIKNHTHGYTCLTWTEKTHGRDHCGITGEESASQGELAPCGTVTKAVWLGNRALPFPSVFSISLLCQCIAHHTQKWHYWYIFPRIWTLFSVFFLQDGLKLHAAFMHYHLVRLIPPVCCREFRLLLKRCSAQQTSWMSLPVLDPRCCQYHVHTCDPDLLALVLTARVDQFRLFYQRGKLEGMITFNFVYYSESYTCFDHTKILNNIFIGNSFCYL